MNHNNQNPTVRVNEKAIISKSINNLFSPCHWPFSFRVGIMEPIIVPPPPANPEENPEEFDFDTDIEIEN